MNFVYGHVGEIVTDTKRLREIAKNADFHSCETRDCVHMTACKLTLNGINRNIVFVVFLPHIMELLASEYQKFTDYLLI